MSENLWQVVQAWASEPLIEALGRSLLHFLWQGAVVAIVLAVVLKALRKRLPQARYLVACAALAVMAMCPVATIIWLSNTSVRLSNMPQSGFVEGASSVAAATNKAHSEKAPRAEAASPIENLSAAAETRAQPAASIPPRASVSINDARPLAPWIVMIWLAGVIALSARLCIGWLVVQRMRRRQVRPVPEGWDERFARIAARMRVLRPVSLLESALVQAPTVIGWLRPIVLVPASAWSGLTPDQLESLLAHELAHVRRHDYALNFAQTVLETLLFYHPAVWWVSRIIRLEREACCDDLAAEFCGDRRQYARALASMEALRSPEPRLALAANGGPLLHRIRRILGVPAPQSNRSGWWLIAAIVASVFAAIAMDRAGGVQAADSDEDQKADWRIAVLDEQIASLREAQKSADKERAATIERTISDLRAQRERFSLRLRILDEQIAKLRAEQKQADNDRAKAIEWTIEDLRALRSRYSKMPATDAEKAAQMTNEYQKQFADEGGWGKESGGLRVRVTPIAPDANDESPDLTKKVESYARGEDLTLAVEFKNVGKKTITLLDAKGNLPFLAPHLFDLEFTDKEGKPIPRSARQVLTSVVMLIEGATHEIEPGKTLVVVLRPAKFNSPMDYRPPPGEYRVRVRYHLDQKLVEQIANLWADKPQGKAWAGEVVSNTAAFTVAENPQVAKAAELKWGQPKNGLRAAVQLLLDGKPLPTDGSQAVPLNTALDVVFHIQNVSDKTISLLEETWHQLDPVTVKDESGKEQTLSGPFYTGLPIMARFTLKPKETAEIRAYPLGIAVDQAARNKFPHAAGPTLFAKPGKYQVRYSVHLGNLRSAASQADDWQGTLPTGETTLTIRARTPQEDAAEQARHFTGRVEFVAKDGKAVRDGHFNATTNEGSTRHEIHAPTSDIPNVTSPATISVIAPGYEETVFSGVELKPDETKRFELTPTEPTRFRLVSQGRPVAGAKVRHFNKTSDHASSGPYPVDGLQGPIRAVSAEDGTVVLSSLQKVNHGYESRGDAVYFFYIEADGFAGRFFGPVKAGENLGDVEMSPPLEVRGEIRGTAEELKNFAAEWDQPYELKTANPQAAWAYAISQRLQTQQNGDKRTFHLTGLRPGKLRFVSNFSPGTHHVTHTYSRRDPSPSDVVVEIDLDKSRADLILTPAGMLKATSEQAK